jgi:iron complex transport system ATP-binding protein
LIRRAGLFYHAAMAKRTVGPEAEPILSLSHVTLIRDGKRILDDVSFIVRRGEHWAVIGKNGAGKSFLLRIIGAQEFPTAGTVDVLGKRFGEYDLWKLKVHIGFVSDQLQARYHPDESGVDIVLSGFFSSVGLYDSVTGSMRTKAQRLLDRLGIRHLAGRRYDELSHGEQRKLLIARALVLDPALLVLDEPCTGLDLSTREDFLRTLSAIAAQGNVSVIIVTHHLEEIVPEINRVLCLKDGRAVAAGEKAGLLTRARLEGLFDQSLTLSKRNGRYWALPH